MGPRYFILTVINKEPVKHISDISTTVMDEAETQKYLDSIKAHYVTDDFVVGQTKTHATDTKKHITRVV